MEQKNFEKQYSIEVFNNVVDLFKKELINLLQEESSYTKEKNNIIKQMSDSIDSLKYPEHIRNKLKEDQIQDLEEMMGNMERNYKKLVQETITNLDHLTEETKLHLEELKKVNSGILKVDQISEEHILRVAINSVEMIKKNFPRNNK